MIQSPYKKREHLTYLFSSLQSCECTEVEVRRCLGGELFTPDLYVGCNLITKPLKVCFSLVPLHWDIAGVYLCWL